MKRSMFEKDVVFFEPGENVVEKDIVPDDLQANIMEEEVPDIQELSLPMDIRDVSTMVWDKIDSLIESTTIGIDSESLPDSILKLEEHSTIIESIIEDPKAVMKDQESMEIIVQEPELVVALLEEQDLSFKEVVVGGESFLLMNGKRMDSPDDVVYAFDNNKHGL